MSGGSSSRKMVHRSIAVLRHLHHRPEQRQVRLARGRGKIETGKKALEKERAPENGKGIVIMRGKWKRNSGGKLKRRVDKETDKGICALPVT